MVYREIIAVCSEIHTKHINTLWGQNVVLLNVKPGGTWPLEFKVLKWQCIPGVIRDAIPCLILCVGGAV
jgi:hypothetical protein